MSIHVYDVHFLHDVLPQRLFSSPLAMIAMG